MYRYVLIDEDGNQYVIADETFTILTDTFTVELDVIEKSFQPGADFPGIQRDMSKKLNYINDFNKPTEQSFRNYMNEFIRQMRKALIIRDRLRSVETDVLMSDYTLNYDKGGFNLGTNENVFNFTQLIPYWRDIEYTIISETGSALQQFTVNNTGYIETFPIITIDAVEPISKFSLYVDETREGIVISDEQFGISGLNTYIIDNTTGTAELDGISRNHKIKNGTGFFSLPVGVSTLIFDSTGEANIEIKYKRRYYL